MNQNIQMLIENANAGDTRSASLLEDEIERRGLSGAYTDCLMWVIYSGDVPSPITHATTRAIWLAIRATPGQRARAFLEAVKDGS